MYLFKSYKASAKIRLFKEIIIRIVRRVQEERERK